MKYSVSFFILLLFITDINGRSKRTTESQWFRDRHGNSIEISDYAARFTKAKTSETVPIYTRGADDVLKMISDYQRSFILLMAGSYRSHFGTGPGNLYVIFTNDLYYCNGSVVAFQVAGESMLANITSNNRNNDVVIDFGHMGIATVNKGLLIHMLKKMDFSVYYRELYCKEGSGKDQLDVRVDDHKVPFNDETQMNVDKALEKYDTELGEIIAYHDKIIQQFKTASKAYTNSLETIVDRLNQKIAQCLRNSQSRQNKPREPEEINDDFSLFIYRKINGVCTAKNQLPLNKDVTVSDALKWKEELLKKQRTIDILQKQLNIIKGNSVNLLNRFGEDTEEKPFGSSLQSPFNASLSNENYSCLLEEEINVCIETFKPNTTTAANSV